MRLPGFSFIDRLSERGLIDRYGFISFAFGGAALIILGKAFGMAAVWVAVFAAGAIVLYAVMVQRTGTGRLRSDQAGDNCYYLGLIYTLASLAYAIFTFDPAGTATTIIQGFGVALATTIIGLVLRVYFSQSRPDIAEAETAARLELAAASGKFKAELSRSIVSMNDFSRQTRQSLEELRDEIVGSLQTIKAGTERTVQDISQHAAGTLSEATDSTVARTKRLATATDKVVTGMETNAASLAALDGVHTQIAASLAALESAASKSQSIFENLVVQSDHVRELQADSSDTIRSLADAASRLNGHVTGLTASTERLESMLGDKLAEIQAVPRAVAENAVMGISDAIDRIRQDLGSIVESQTSLMSDLVGQAQQGADVAARHNRALESELARSRENVTRVHTALVEMTEKLASGVETRSG